MMRRGTAITFALILLTAGAAEAREWRVTLGGGSARVMDQGLLAAVETGWIAGFDLGFQVEVGPDILVGVSYQSGGAGSEAALLGTRSSLFVLDLMATARWHVAVLSWFRPFVEIGVGANRTAWDLETADLADARWAAAVSGRAGVEFRLPPGMLFGGDFSLGIDLSGGYIWRSVLDFDDVEGIDLGELDLHGAVWRVGLAVMW